MTYTPGTTREEQPRAELPQDGLPAPIRSIDTARVSVVMPAFNEAAVAGEVARRVRALLPAAEIIVVDDGSTDGTAEALIDTGVTVVRHPYNKGNGAAVKTGIRTASREIILLLDADGQHNPAEIESILEPMDQYDLVVGARTAESDASPVRTLGNRMLNMIASYLVERPIPDLTSGFRAMRREVIRQYVHLLPNGYSYPSTSTLSLIKAGYNVAFVPVQARRRVGKSKVRLARDGTKFILIILRITTLFSPLRVFFPIAVLVFLLGLASTAWTILEEGRLHVPNSAELAISMSIIIFLMGLVSEQISALRLESRP